MKVSSVDLYALTMNEGVVIMKNFSSEMKNYSWYRNLTDLRTFLATEKL